MPEHHNSYGGPHWDVVSRNGRTHRNVYPQKPTDNDCSPTPDSIISIVCTSLKFYTHSDEGLLFAWFDSLASIVSYKGIGRELHLHFSSNTIADDDLLELMGIFARYKFKNKKQLEIFMNESNKQWFEK